jgi:hypothetical protein
MVVQLTILVGNVDDLIGLDYSHIEVYQSTDQGNSFQEITASLAQAAVKDSTPAQTMFQMGGKLLKLKIDGGAEQSISFSDLIPLWTPTQVVNRINEVVPGLASVQSVTTVRLTSPTTGRASSVEITYTDALDLFSATGIVYGKAARVALVGGTLLYTFPDVAGKETDRYKWRFSANGVAPFSDFSEVVSGSVAPTMPAGNLAVAMAQFFDSGGQPKKVRVLVGMDSNPQQSGSAFIVQGPSKVVDSDNNGFLQMTLVRGSRCRVAIEGSTYVREFIVPDVASFDLMSVMAMSPDPFTVQQVPPQLIRRSL